jgi:uncharacterized membrane protein SpoIIM required for sporulation
VARSTSLDQDLIAYLESLSARGYFFLYGTRSKLFEKIRRFFAYSWPTAAQGLWRETLVSLVLTAVGAFAAFTLVTSDADWYHSFVPQQLANGRDPTASTAMLRETLYRAENTDNLSVFATQLFTHNSQVALVCFALGFAFGLPTMMSLIYNGCMLGAFFALFGSRGLAFELGGWLAIHGVTEIYAIVLAGAAGFHIGWAVAFPGDQSRMEAASTAGKRAATLMGGVVIMLLVAGGLEGFGRQMIHEDILRYVIGFGIGALWMVYLYLPRRARTD